jgi:hypothetical protein
MGWQAGQWRQALPLIESMKARLFSISIREPKRLCLAPGESDIKAQQPRGLSPQRVRAAIVQSGAAGKRRLVA